MSKIFGVVPYPFHLKEAQKLLMTVVQTNPTATSAKALAEDSGLPAYLIEDHPAVYFVWRGIFREAAAQGVLKKLVQTVHDRLNASSPARPYLAQILNEEPVVVDAEPRSADGSPSFIDGSDDVSVSESLLYKDDLTIDIGKIENLIKVLRQLKQLSPSVCKLLVSVGDTRQFGTAFRIGKDKLLTNWHVVHNEKTGAPATAIHAEFGYEVDDDGKPLSGTPIVCDHSSFPSSKENDWAIITPSETLEDKWNIIKLSDHEEPEVEQPAYIIQHPMGDRKRIAYVRNRISQMNDRVVHYLSDTQQGSSGSPVLNSHGKLIALHHAGGRPQQIAGRPPLVKNEGIRISQIIKDLETKGISFA